MFVEDRPDLLIERTELGGADRDRDHEPGILAGAILRLDLNLDRHVPRILS